VSGEVLSQEEFEDLLNIMCDPAPGKEEEDIFWNFFRDAGQENKSDVDDTDTVVECKELKNVDRKQLKTLQLIHDKFARKLAAKLSMMLPIIVDIRLINVDRLYYSEFVFGLDNPASISLLHIKTPQGEENTILYFDLSVLSVLIDRMCGGGCEPTCRIRRPLTNIESRLAQRIIDVILNELKVIWQKEYELTITQTESNPQLIEPFDPNDTVIVLCFEFSLIEVSGHMALCIPVQSCIL